MKRKLIPNRRVLYQILTGLLTGLVIAALVLANTLFGKLAKRYGWYTDLREKQSYAVSEQCYQVLGTLLESTARDTGKAEPIDIIFCDTEDNLRADSVMSYVYRTATELADRFDRIRVKCYDIVLNPVQAEPYRESTVIDGKTGEVEVRRTALYNTSVIIASGDYHRVYSRTEFFSFEGGDLSNVWAYKGEKKLTAGILRAIDPQDPTVYLTSNHGEAYYDYEILYLLDDAGYTLAYLDLSRDPIPADCSLIITFNPNKDFLENDGISTVSEKQKLDEFLRVPGNTYLVFLENGTPELPNLESYLSEWGVSTAYHTAGTGVKYRYMVQDTSASLTSDGYTIYGKQVKTGRSGEILSGLPGNAIFQDATALFPASGFVPAGDGSYTKGNRTLYSLYEMSDSAVSWANGAVVDRNRAMLMTLTEQTQAGGSSYVGVIASADFATEQFLQSAVYGNSDLLFRTLHAVGKTYTPEGVTIKPFSSTTMSTVTTAQKWRWTVGLAVLPAILTLAIAIPVLVRRKHS